MNRKSITITGILTLVFLITGFMTGCKSGGGKGTGEEVKIAVSDDNDQIIKDMNEAKKIFNALPSPLESAMLVKSAGTKLKPELLNSVSGTSKYVTSKSMALNLGIYTCDLSFTSLYEQTQMIVNYMNAAKKMAEGLNILNSIDQATIVRLEQNINNSDEVLEIISDTFLNSSSYLEDNGQHALATLTLAGGWIEGLYISTQLVDKSNIKGNMLANRIIDQKLSLDILMNLLSENKGTPAIDEVIPGIEKLKTIFDKIEITTTPNKTEVDKTSNMTLIKSQASTNITPEVFAELAGAVAEIRNSYVN